MTHFDDDLNACAALVQKGDPDRFLAAMAAPVAARKVLFPLYAFNVEVARAPYASQEPMIAEMRLQWWWDALEEIAGGGPVRRHEVTVPLAHVLAPEGARLLQGLVDARRRDARREPPETLAALGDYLGDTAGVLLWVAARALGGAQEDRARRVGFLQGLANYLLALPALRAHGTGMPHVAPDAWRDFLSVRLDAVAGLGRAERPQSWAELAAWQARPVVARALRHPDRIDQGALEDPGAMKRLRLMWAAARA